MKMDVMSAGEGPLSKKGATFRKLFTTIGGVHFKSATEIVVNNSYLIARSASSPKDIRYGVPVGMHKKDGSDKY